MSTLTEVVIDTQEEEGDMGRINTLEETSGTEELVIIILEVKVEINTPEGEGGMGRTIALSGTSGTERVGKIVTTTQALTTDSHRIGSHQGEGVGWAIALSRTSGTERVGKIVTTTQALTTDSHRIGSHQGEGVGRARITDPGTIKAAQGGMSSNGKERNCLKEMSRHHRLRSWIQRI
jgi:hypothetical protein